MNVIFNAVSMEEFKRISNVKVAHTAWNILQTVHKGTKAVKINKLQQLTSKFESIKMSDDESFDEFYAKLNDIVNSAYNLGKIYDQPKIVRKILRSLTENFRPKVTTITKSKDVGSISIDELVGSLQSYELDLPKTSKFKSMTLSQLMMLRLVDLMISFLLQRLLTLSRILETFSGIIIERQDVRTLLNLEILGRMIPLRLTIMINLEKK